MSCSIVHSKDWVNQRRVSIALAILGHNLKIPAFNRFVDFDIGLHKVIVSRTHPKNS